ncbi:hypothetical protein TCDM_14359 [Trypanosoma cruzi Dm28c]|uniref:Uncharacterized protein n=1 Tax=Trypanosoma cruzi Dm28c TaxID=1416333 RepID=V5BHX2_TRYCR|nr:hypothetical protein TCDM_14359 [Trypanosoma cruzi Dm28c]
MPLKFAPKGLNPEDSMRLAVVHMLRHDNAVILQTFTGKRGSSATRRGRLLRFMPHFPFCPTERTGETAEEAPHLVEIAPLQLPYWARGSSRETMWPAARTPGAVHPSPPHSPHFLAEGSSSLFLSISLPHFDLPLVFASPRRERRCSRACRAELSPRAVMNRDVAATWDEMLSAFCAAWSATVRIEKTPFALLPPSLSHPLLAEQPLGEGRVPLPDEPAASFRMDPIVVPRRKLDRQRSERMLPPILAVVVAGKWKYTPSAFKSQEAVLQRRFLAVARTLESTTAAPSPPLIVASVDTPLTSDAAGECERLELASVAVPPLMCTQKMKAGRPWREGGHAGARNTLVHEHSESLFSRMPPRMTRATELRFPDGKHMRQTLTLRNTAKERLQKIFGLRPPRRHRQKMAEWFSTSKFSIARSRELAAAALLPSTVLSAASRVKPPHCSERKRRRGDFPPSPPPLQLLPHVRATAVFAFSSWQPLTLEEEEEEENNDTCCEEDLKIAPLRVFPREVELQSFQQLLERGIERNGKAMRVGNYDEEEKRYHAAFVHDVNTMPLPYREVSGLVEDARLHYCYRLALHREKRRLGL